MSHEVVRTRGGALAVRCHEAGEIMHPGVGPLAEAAALYVAQSRLGDRLRGAAGGTLVVFDVGLGAASNAVAALAEAERTGGGAGRLDLHSFERDRGALELALCHGAAFGLEGDRGQAARALLATGRHDGERSTWRLQDGDVLEALGRQLPPADIIFWDPFSARANPTLWTVAAFSAARRAAGPRCTLFTYSASTATRVALLLGGWAVGIGDATGDKAQTTAAAVDPGDLARPLPSSWLTRLSRADVPLPPDAPADVVLRVAAAPQFNPGP